MTSKSAQDQNTASFVETSMRGLWAAAPAYLAGSFAAFVVSLGVLWILPLPSGSRIGLLWVAVGPAYAGLVAVGCAVLCGQQPGLRASLRALRDHAIAGLTLAAFPGGTALAAAASYALVDSGSRWWLLMPFGLSAGCAVLFGLGFVAAVPLKVLSPQLRLPALWAVALHLIARRPVPFAGALSLGFVGIWLSVHLSASVLLVVFAPLAAVANAAVFTTGKDLGVIAITD